jgi:CDP-diacylglycerol---serine O-phosphatidyltransferase
VPRTPWGRRRTTDSPRPAGRWAGRLRRSGSLARQVFFVRVVRRSGRIPFGSPGRVPFTRSARGPAAGVHLMDPAASVRFVDPAAAVRFVDPARPTSEPLARIAAPVSPVPFAPPAATGAVAAAPRRPVPLLPGEPTLARRVRFAAVNGCTLASLALGLSAILASVHGQIRWAALCLVGCVVFDGLDGALARRLGVASPFGAQLDSLADMCSFGVAAPVVVYTGLHHSASPALVGAACVLVAGCAAIRLARFNVSPKDGRFFCGVPTTTVAAVLGLGILIGLRPPGTVAVAALAVLALAMVSGFPYAKLGRLATLPPWLWLAPAVGLLLDYRITFAALVALYLASGPLLWLRRRQ